MSAAATAWAWEKIKSGRVSGTAALVLLKLSDRADDDGKCWPSNQRTAVDCNIDVRSARRATSSLQKKGLLTKERRKRDHGGDSSNHYFLTISEASGGEGNLPSPAGQYAPPPEGNMPSPGGQYAPHNHKGEPHSLNLSPPQPPRARGAADVDQSDVVVVVSEEDQARLIWPTGLVEDQRTSMRTILLGKSWPGLTDAQALLDELAGQLAVPGKVRNAAGLLRKLQERQRDGLFTLEFGLEVQQIREARRKQQEREAAAQGRKGPQPREQAHGASPEAPAVDQAGLASARQLLSKLRPTAKAGAAGL